MTPQWCRTECGNDPRHSVTSYIIRWLLGLALLYLSWKLVAPFIPALTLALALAIIMHPLQGSLEKRFGSQAIATVGVISVVIVGIMLPGIVLLSRIGHEVISGIGHIHGAAESGEIERMLRAHPTLAHIFQQWNARFEFESTLGQFGASVAALVSRMFSNSVWVVMQISVAVFAMFFFLRDRAGFYALLVDLTPMPRKDVEQLCLRIAETIRAAMFDDPHELSLYNALPEGSVPTDLGSTKNILAPSAVFRTLGLVNDDPATDPPDFGSPPAIGFNSATNFDFDASDGIDEGKYDFEGVALHTMDTSWVSSRRLGNEKKSTLRLMSP